jgi:hypothetical protein
MIFEGPLSVYGSRRIVSLKWQQPLSPNRKVHGMAQEYQKI